MEVFENPDVIMTKFIQTIIDKVVQVSNQCSLYVHLPVHVCVVGGVEYDVNTV